MVCSSVAFYREDVPPGILRMPNTKVEAETGRPYLWVYNVSKRPNNSGHVLLEGAVIIGSGRLGQIE
jgi:hypothetical protein